MKTKLTTDERLVKADRGSETQALLTDVRELILAARQTVARGG